MLAKQKFYHGLAASGQGGRSVNRRGWNSGAQDLPLPRFVPGEKVENPSALPYSPTACPRSPWVWKIGPRSSEKGRMPEFLTSAERFARTRIPRGHKSESVALYPKAPWVSARSVGDWANAHSGQSGVLAVRSLCGDRVSYCGSISQGFSAGDVTRWRAAAGNAIHGRANQESRL